MNRRILLTAIGSFSADFAIRTLRQNGDFVVGTDIYPADWHFESSLCDAFRQAPLATDTENYIRFLTGLIKEFRISHLNPLTDLEIDVINAHRDVFEQTGVKLCFPSAYTLHIARDKFELVKTFLGSEVEVPVSVATDKENNPDSNMPGLPAIAKPRSGRSSEGLMRLESPEELNRVLKMPGYIVQEMIDGPVFCVDYVRDAAGNDFAVGRKELLRTKNGAGTTVEIIPDPELSRLASEVGRRIGVNGVINMEFILNNGKYYLIDINPRFSAGVAFTAVTGYDMVCAQMDIADGKEISGKEIEIRHAILQKRFTEVVNRQF